MEKSGEIFKWITYSLLCTVADALDTILSTVASDSLKRPKASLLASDIDGLSDQDILALKQNATRLSTVWLLTPNTVAKVSRDVEEDAPDASEANALNLVFEKTTIPVPRVRRVVKRKWDDYLIVMDYIKGQTLAEVWSTLSLWKKVHVAFTLRRYIRQLHCLKASTTTPPGPLSTIPRACESPPIFGPILSYRGPFASYGEMTTFFNERCEMGLDANRFPKDDPSRKELFDDSSPLVLTHQDLNPRNIILGEDGRLWIIDWAWSGYYPPWFEYVTMQGQMENEKLVGFEDRFWECMIPFVCGPYFKQHKWLSRMGRGLYLA